MRTVQKTYTTFVKVKGYDENFDKDRMKKMSLELLVKKFLSDDFFSFLITLLFFVLFDF